MVSKAWWRWMGWLLGRRNAMTRGTTRVEPGPIVHRVLGVILKLATRVGNLVFTGSHFPSKTWNFLTRVAWQSMSGIARGHPHIPCTASLRRAEGHRSTKSSTALPWRAIRGFWRAIALLWCAHPFNLTGIPSQSGRSLKGR